MRPNKSSSWSHGAMVQRGAVPLLLSVWAFACSAEKEQEATAVPMCAIGCAIAGSAELELDDRPLEVRLCHGDECATVLLTETSSPSLEQCGAADLVSGGTNCECGSIGEDFPFAACTLPSSQEANGLRFGLSIIPVRHESGRGQDRLNDGDVWGIRVTGTSGRIHFDEGVTVERYEVFSAEDACGEAWSGGQSCLHAVLTLGGPE
jgi:hypothetical protein